MEIKLEKVKIEEREILNNLLEYYQYDFNIFYDDDLNKNGRFEFIKTDKYFNKLGNQAFFVMVDEKYAGFILISNDTVYEKNAWSIEEFWIMPKYRKGMFCFQVLKKLVNKIKGKIEFIVLKENKRWLKTLNYWIEKNFIIEKKEDIKKWDNYDFTLFVIDTKNKEN